MTNNHKDTVYIDVDDEITSVIDKVNDSSSKIVALVLPKRSSVFQSVVNMKLLKRTADETKKNIVLITSEAALMPLAGAVGLHVAPTLQSKPEIPPPPSAQPKIPSPDDDIDKTKPVGELAGKPPEEESLEVDNRPKDQPDSGKRKKASKDGGPKKKLKIPNFEKFRTRLILAGVGGVALIAFVVLALFVLPRATVRLDADTSNLDINLDFLADTKATRLDTKERILPALAQESRVSDSEKVAATGQKDLGNRATGNLSLKNCSNTTGTVTVPQGTRVTSGNLAFRTQTTVDLPETSLNPAQECKTQSQAVAVQAENPGEQYNLAGGKSFSVSGYSGVQASNSDSFSGGTSQIVKIVAQADVDKAQAAIQSRANNNTPDELKEELEQEGFMPLEATLAAGNPTITTSPNVGDEASEVTVNSATTYSMTGVKKADLEELIENDSKDRIDAKTQVIRDNGLSKATISVRQTGGSAGQVPLLITTKAVAGPNLNEDSIKREIVGKNRKEIEDLLNKRPGINKVDVSFSPFWVRSAPKSDSKISIVVTNDGND